LSKSNEILTVNALLKFCENRARDKPLQGVYIPHFDQVSVKISVLGLLYPNRCTDWGEIWHGVHPRQTDSRATVYRASIASRGKNS